MSDRLERLLSELGDELESRREADRLRLAEWFAGVLGSEYDKRTAKVNLVEALRSGATARHDLGAQEDGDEERSDR